MALVLVGFIPLTAFYLPKSSFQVTGSYWASHLAQKGNWLSLWLNSLVPGPRGANHESKGWVFFHHHF